MLAQNPAGVRRGKDAGQPAVTGDESAPHVPVGHFLEYAVERLAHVDGEGVRHEDIANKQLVLRR